MADKQTGQPSGSIDTEGELSIAIPDRLNPSARGSALWLSTTPTEPLDKARMVNMIGGQLPKLDDIINTTIAVSDVGRVAVELTDKRTGEVYDGVRTILFCNDGKAFGTVSDGVSKSLALIFGGWGKPPWRPPLPLRVKQLNIEGGKRYFQLEIDVDALAAIPAGKRK